MNEVRPKSTAEVFEGSLAGRLRERIRSEGAITFHDFMQAALYDARDGYYNRQGIVRWGRTGDYRTSAESSSLFAHTFAAYFATLYEQLGAPARWTLFEAGAGAGHFAYGVLETFARDYPQTYAATDYVIDETSADARTRAIKNLVPFNDRIAFRRLTEIESFDGACIVFSNELLDAFPVHRVVMRGGKLFELYVGIDRRDKFCWNTGKLSTTRLAAYLEQLPASLLEEQIIEVNFAAEDFIKSAGERLREGFIITVDYGAETPELLTASHYRRGTLRGFYKHQLVENPLDDPGGRDLTTTIDWTQIRRAGDEAGLQTVLFARQDEFLLHAGLLEILEREAARAQDETARAQLRLSAREMILPERLSQHFQVMVQRKFIENR
ncbi:MAG: class I SAM-dependent methyltransferase [Pyrinomonadaceae bacterium]